MINKKLGFTLAEVLLTIMVIGVLACETIPTLMHDFQEKVIVTSLKKAASEISQATIIINSDCSGSVLNCLTNPTAPGIDSATSTELFNLYNKNLKVIKDCGMSTTGCWPNVTYKYLKNTNWINVDTFTSAFYKFVLNDGSSVALGWLGGSNSPRFTFIIDTNGSKPPNQMGRDLFFFGYNNTTNLLEPFGASWFSDTCDDPATDTGQGCTARIIQEDAINY